MIWIYEIKQADNAEREQVGVRILCYSYNDNKEAMTIANIVEWHTPSRIESLAILWCARSVFTVATEKSDGKAKRASEREREEEHCTRGITTKH